jgi:hypothetical protein
MFAASAIFPGGAVSVNSISGCGASGVPLRSVHAVSSPNACQASLGQEFGGPSASPRRSAASPSVREARPAPPLGGPAGRRLIGERVRVMVEVGTVRILNASRDMAVHAELMGRHGRSTQDAHLRRCRRQRRPSGTSDAAKGGRRSRTASPDSRNWVGPSSLSGPSALGRAVRYRLRRQRGVA